MSNVYPNDKFRVINLRQNESLSTWYYGWKFYSHGKSFGEAIQMPNDTPLGEVNKRIEEGLEQPRIFHKRITGKYWRFWLLVYSIKHKIQMLKYQ